MLLTSEPRAKSCRPHWFIRVLLCLVFCNVSVELFALLTSSELPAGIIRGKLGFHGFQGFDKTDWHRTYPLPLEPAECHNMTNLSDLLGLDESSLDAQLQDIVQVAMLGCRSDVCTTVVGIGKVALMLLSKGDITHELLWKTWFLEMSGRLPLNSVQGAVCRNNSDLTNKAIRILKTLCTPKDEGVIASQHLYSVYIHTPPSYSGFGNESIFDGYMVSHRTKTRWGSFELVLATKLLLRDALQNTANKWFVLLSESDVPLYPPTLIYQQLMHEPLSRIDACGEEDATPRRYVREMEEGGVAFKNWRKSWQWFMLIRTHAQAVVDDMNVHKTFEKHCNPRNPHEGRDCYSDEHYIPTLLSVIGKENETSCQRTITNVDWRAGGAHPRTYKQHEINPLRIRLLRRPHKRCSYTAAIRAAKQLFGRIEDISQGLCKGEFVYTHPLGTQCPLFARKFPPPTASNLFRTMNDCNSKLHILTESRCGI